MIESQNKPGSNQGNCVRCKIAPTIASMAVTNAACQIIEDKDKREACTQFANAIDFSKLEDSAEPIAHLIEQYGSEILDKLIVEMNSTVRAGVVRAVEKMLSDGKTVEPKLMIFYKDVKARQAIQ